MRPLELARRWHREGFVTAAGLEALEARYKDDDASNLTTALLAGAGAVLAAAIIAIPFLAEFRDDSIRFYLLISGLIVAATAGALWPFVKWKEAAEALAVTAGALIVPSAMMFLYEGSESPALAFLFAAIGAALLALPTRTAIVATVGAAAMHILFAAGVAEQFTDEVGLSLWLLLCLAGVGAAFITYKLPVWRERHAIINLAAPLILGGASVAWWGEVIEPDVDFPASGELVVALLQAPVLAAAFYLRNRPVLMGSVFVIAIDAIVFGFDIGELYLGIPMLLLVAGGLVALALWARRPEPDS